MQICLILLPGFALSSLSLTQEVIDRVNDCAGQALLCSRILTATGQPVQSREGALITPEQDGWSGAEGHDLVLICAGDTPFANLNMGLRGFVSRASSNGATLGGLGTGGLALAKLGLLQNHIASLPEHDEPFRNIAETDRPHALDRQRLTAGFGLSPIGALLDWIARDVSLSLSAQAGRMMHYGSTRPAAPESPDPLLQRMQAVMAANLADPLDMEKVAETLDLSPKQLRLRCTKALGAPPSLVYLHLRLDRAWQLVNETRLPVEEIAKATGFGTPSSLTRAFRARFNSTPRSLRTTPARSAA